MKPISKITIARWTGGVTQVVKHLLCKCRGKKKDLSVSSDSHPHPLFYCATAMFCFVFLDYNIEDWGKHRHLLTCSQLEVLKF
jgi:hypothetical protein